MAGNKIERSQQESQGKAIGTANDDIGMTDGAVGPQNPKEHKDDRHIENQDRSSATSGDQKSREKDR